MSWGEIERKADSAMWGWWAAGEGSGGFLFLVRLAVEVALTVPVGWALAARGQRPAVGLAAAGILGLLLGAAIEVAQFFVASGVSQGVSVFTRALGVVFGVATWRHRVDLAATLRGMPTAFKLALGLLYAAVLLTANGWFSSRWSGAGVAERLAEVHFLPFYYHYFTTEAKALYSLAGVGLMYAPLGALVWLGSGRGGRAAAMAVAAAAGVEAGKLFLVGSHPDPTNLLIAAVAGGLPVGLLQVLTRPPGAAGEKDLPASPQPPATGAEPAGGKAPSHHRHRREATAPAPSRPGPFALALAAVAFPVLAWKLAGFPVLAPALGLGIAAAAVAVWRRPAWIFVIVPAALPVLDLAPWSGRFYLDEFDFLLLALVPVAYWRVPRGPRRRREADGPLWLALGLLAFSVALSTAIGLGVAPGVDANSFTNYYSPFNALRIAKGFAWALLLLGLCRRFRRGGEDVRPALAWGMAAGLALTVAVILWERVTFSGLFNFDSVYRATGPFSAIHTGGAYIECFLAAAVPFLAVLLLERRALLLRLGGLGLLLGATYALMVTYSRNGYSAYGVALVTVFFFALFARELRWKRFVLPVVLAGAVLAAALPVFLGGFAQERMGQIGRDLGIRQAHWEDSLAMRDEGLGTALFGVGIGRYPETAFWRSRGQKRSGAYRLEAEGGNTFLRLTPGESIYMEQFVPLQPQTDYVLKADLRARSADAQFTLPVCQKWMLASYECVWKTVKVGDKPEAWHHHEIRFNAGVVGGGPWYARRPVKLSLYNPNPASAVDVDNLSLEPAGGPSIVRNGDFAQGLDRWFFSTDSHLQWHAKSLPVAVLFDQGWLGLAAWALFLGLALLRLGRGAWRGDLQAAAIAGSVAGILVVGLFDTVIDAPRFLLLLVLLAGIGALPPPKASA